MSGFNFGNSLYQQIFKETGEFVIFQEPEGIARPFIESSDRQAFKQQDPAKGKDQVNPGDLFSGINVGHIDDADSIPKYRQQLMYSEGAVIGSQVIQNRHDPILFERGMFDVEDKPDTEIISNFALERLFNTHSDGTIIENNKSTTRALEKSRLDKLSQREKQIQLKIEGLRNAGIPENDKEVVRLNNELTEVRHSITPSLLIKDVLQKQAIEDEKRAVENAKLQENLAADSNRLLGEIANLLRSQSAIQPAVLQEPQPVAQEPQLVVSRESQPFREIPESIPIGQQVFDEEKEELMDQKELSAKDIIKNLKQKMSKLEKGLKEFSKEKKKKLKPINQKDLEGKEPKKEELEENKKKIKDLDKKIKDLERKKKIRDIKQEMDKLERGLKEISEKKRKIKEKEPKGDPEEAMNFLMQRILGITNPSKKPLRGPINLETMSLKDATKFLKDRDILIATNADLSRLVLAVDTLRKEDPDELDLIINNFVDKQLNRIDPESKESLMVTELSGEPRFTMENRFIRNVINLPPLTMNKLVSAFLALGIKPDLLTRAKIKLVKGGNPITRQIEDYNGLKIVEDNGQFLFEFSTSKPAIASMSEADLSDLAELIKTKDINQDNVITFSDEFNERASNRRRDFIRRIPDRLRNLPAFEIVKNFVDSFEKKK